MSNRRPHTEILTLPLRRMRWRGLAKATAQVHLTAIAYNLKRTRSIILAGV